MSLCKDASEVFKWSHASFAGLASYIRILADFTTTSFPHDASSDLIQSLPRWLVHFDHRKSYKPSMTSFPTIHQTSANPLFVNGSGWMGNQTRLVEDEGWNRMIWDDRAISEWFERLFEKGRGDDPGVRQVWELLETSETRAKSFKYLIVLLEGALVSRCAINNRVIF